MSGGSSSSAGELTSFVGREALLESLADLLRQGQRSLTLAGPAGVGKTRLAMALRRGERSRFDATALVGLAELDSGADRDSSRDSIIALISAELGIVDHQSTRPPLDVLVDHLRRARTLLVIDNAEHVIGPVGDVLGELLAAVPELYVVTTSRTHLEIAGEYVRTVPPVDVPEAGAARDRAVEFDAVTVLRDRAAAAGRPITDADDWGAIVDLVRWSGGLPLVLELIAAQLGGGMSPAVIRDRLDGGRILRNTPRKACSHHSTLTVALDISWALCAPAQQRLWSRLSVFPAGFDLEAAESVAGGDELIATGEVMGLLADLVRQSILVAGADGRFQQPQPLREFAMRRLRESGEQDRLRERHCDWVDRLTATAAEEWFGTEELHWLRRIHQELPNVRAAVGWCRADERRVGTGLRIATNVLRVRVPFFYALQSMIAGWLDGLLAAAPARSVARMDALALLGWMRIVLGDVRRSEACRTECLELARELGAEDSPSVLYLEGTHRCLARNDDSGLALLAAARDGFRAAGADGDAHMAGLLLAICAGLLGPAGLADRVTEDCVAEAKDRGAEWALTWALWTLGLPARTEPQDMLHRCLPEQIALGDRWGTTWCIEFAAWQRSAGGEAEHAETAALLLGGCGGLQRRHGVAVAGLLPFAHQRELAARRIIETIGESDYRAAYAEGERLSTDEVYRLALRPRRERALPGRSHGLTMRSLTATQRTVATLVRDGMANKAIAEELHISRRTVENHLAAIFGKLGIGNRTQLATWVSRQQNG